MPLRFIACSVDVAGQMETPRVFLYPATRRAIAHRPGENWCLAIVLASDFAPMEADAQCVDLLEKLSDAANATNRAELLAWLRSTAIRDIPAAARTRIQARLEARGISTAGLVLATPLLEVIQRVFEYHSPGQDIREFG